MLCSRLCKWFIYKRWSGYSFRLFFLFLCLIYVICVSWCI